MGRPPIDGGALALAGLPLGGARGALIYLNGSPEAKRASVAVPITTPWSWRLFRSGGTGYLTFVISAPVARPNLTSISRHYRQIFELSRADLSRLVAEIGRFW